MPICLIDHTDHPSLEVLHKYLRQLKMKQEDYYVRYYNRRDRLTDQPIPFKNVKQYLVAEFINKDNLKMWLAAEPKRGRQWAIDWLIRRKAEKSLIYPPLQIELRSLMCPTIRFFNHIGGYHVICQDLGYTIRFVGTLPVTVPALSCPVVVDTREQKSLHLGIPTISAKLNCGDYGLPEPYDQQIYIERKSLNDFIGTMSGRYTDEVKGESNLTRFARELERAKELGAYVIMLVESSIDDVLGLGHNGIPVRGAVNPDHLFHSLRDLCHRFDNFQALFVDGRKEAANAVIKLLALGAVVKTVDLQFQYESGNLGFTP